MKALNIDQPWAELIIRGQKTIELRRTRTSHRGILAIRATQTVWEPICLEFGLEPANLAKAAILGTVELVEWIELTPERFAALREQHLSRMFSPGKWKWAWRLANPQRLPVPILCGALPGMFNLPDEIAVQISAAH